MFFTNGHMPGGIAVPHARPLPPARYNISGVTRDSVGAALGGCTIEIYEAGSGLLRGSTTSDANGNYSIDVTSSETGLTFQATAYLSGSPDVAGVTVQTLVGTPS